MHPWLFAIICVFIHLEMKRFDFPANEPFSAISLHWPAQLSHPTAQDLLVA